MLFSPKKDSWHYKLVYTSTKEVVGPYNIDQALPKDFCTYWRLALTGLIRSSIPYIALILIVLVFFVFIPYMAAVDMSITFWLAVLHATILYFAVTAFIVISILFSMLVTKIKNFFKKKKTETLLDQDQSSSSFFTTKIKSMKNKVCLPVNYGEDK